MGKKSLMMIMVALMAFFMIVMPVSANVVGTKVSQGATVFIGEEGLDINAVFPSSGGIINTPYTSPSLTGIISEANDGDHPVGISGTLTGGTSYETISGTLEAYDTVTNIAPIYGTINGTINGTFTGFHNYNAPNLVTGTVTGTKDGQSFSGVITGSFLAPPEPTGKFVGSITGTITTNSPVSSNSVGWLSSGSNVDNPSKTLPITDTMKNYFSVSPSEFSGYTGNWYLLTSGGTIATPRIVAFYVADPQLNMDIWNPTTGQSVNGKSVVHGTDLTFRIDTNMAMNENSQYRQRVGTTGTSTYAPFANFTVFGNENQWGVTDASNNTPNEWNWSITCDGCGYAPCTYSTNSLVTNYHSGEYTVVLKSWNDINDGASEEKSEITGHLHVDSTGVHVVSFTTATLPDPLVGVSGSSLGGHLNPSLDGFITIKVKSSSGASYTSLYTPDGSVKPITDLFVNSSPFYWGGSSDVSKSFKWETGHRTGNQYDYPPGTYVVVAESNLNRMKENYRLGGADYTGKTVTGSYTVTLTSDMVKLDINKESVVRGNPFSVTLTGKPYGDYTLKIKSVSNATTAPIIMSNQEGVTNFYDTSNVTIRTDGSGERTIEFSTNPNTYEHKYTIRAELIGDASKYDEVYINVAEGMLTLAAEGDQTYYLGEEIKLEGTNTETDNVYFFIIGPNLNSNGANINYPSVTVVTGNASTFRSVEVESDDTFKYDWSTAMVDLDAGTYTIYAVSMPNAKSDLSDVAYATTSIVIKKPYVSAKVPKNIIAKGDAIKIVGEASGDPSSVKIWILGKNFVKSVDQSVDSDDTYEYEVPAGETTGMASGQYFIVVQHPMQNGVFDIYRDGNYVYNAELGGDEKNMQIFTLEGGGSLQGSDAAQALVEAINDPNIDDTYTKLNFMLSEAVIAIDPIPDKHIGDKFTLTGKTNLAVDDEILIEVYSSSFGPTQKTKSGEFSGTTGSVKVVKGTSNDGYNTFSLDIDATSFKADEYLVMAEGIIQDATGTALFNVLDYVPTPVPTVATPIPTVIEPVTVPPTVPPTIEPTAVPTTTKSPGFGAVLACIGLMGVGFVVMRRS